MDAAIFFVNVTKRFIYPIPVRLQDGFIGRTLALKDAVTGVWNSNIFSERDRDDKLEIYTQEEIDIASYQARGFTMR
jgi:hypothetical protein